MPQPNSDNGEVSRSEDSNAAKMLATPADWDSCIDSIGPAAMLLVIGERMNVELRAQFAPEDIWQEALLRAWRARANFEWRGTASFRRWLLEIAEHCIWDAVDRMRTQKRGGGAIGLAIDGAAASDSRLEPAFALIASTTPSRVAVHREQSEAMREALASLPADLRDVLWLRLFEGLSCNDVATRLNLGVSAVKHRFRKAGLLYRQRLEHLRSSCDASQRGPSKQRDVPPSSTVPRADGR